MSSYLRRYKNPITLNYQVCLCIDDFYEHYVYGYGFRKDGKDATWNDFKTKKEMLKKCDFYKWDDVICNMDTKYQPQNGSWSSKDNEEENIPLFNTEDEAQNYIDNRVCKVDGKTLLKDCDACKCEWYIEKIIT